MPSQYDAPYFRKDMRKPWRYPETPIPDRLKYRYK